MPQKAQENEEEATSTNTENVTLDSGQILNSDKDNENEEVPNNNINNDKNSNHEENDAFLEEPNINITTEETKEE